MNQRYFTSTLDVPSLLAHLNRASVGFDRMFETLHNTAAGVPSTGNYPPHDIIKHSDTKYSIEIAAAGFKEDELSVTVDNNVLTITGEQKSRQERDYLYHGISSKSFTKTLNLAEHVIVGDAKFENGMLIVEVEIVVPEEFKPRKIAIKSSTPTQQIAAE